MSPVPSKENFPDSSFSYPPESYIRYLNNPTVQAAIGAFVNYTEQSLAVAEAFNTTGDDGRLDGTTINVRALVEEGVTVDTPLGRIKALAHKVIGHDDVWRRGLQQYVLPLPTSVITSKLKKN